MKVVGQTVSALHIFLFVVLLAVIALLTTHLWHGDVLVHTDVARDLLVVREIVETKQLTLIGPRSSMPGIFHGPLWYYVCLIPFILVKGNPVLMGWSWWLMGVGAIGVFWFACQKVTKNLTVSLLAAICFALLELPSAAGPTNTYFANLFAFFPFLLWWKWYRKPSWLLALGGWLTLGLLVQFQMAFFIPLAMLWLPVFIWRCYVKKQVKQLVTVAVFLLPLTTFFLFDVRHDWLQIKSLFMYFQTPSSTTQSFVLRILERMRQAFLEGGDVFGIMSWLNLGILVIFVVLAWRSHSKEVKQLCILLGYLYFGWWIATLVFSGTIWNFYYDPFASLFLFTMVVIASRSRPAHWLLALLTVCLLFGVRGDFFYTADRFNSSSWKLLSSIAAQGLAEPDAGYFLYSQDQFAYPLKYAFAYYRQQHSESQASGYVKKPLTVLVKSTDNPDNPFSTSSDWQKNKLHIAIEPVEVIKYPHGYVLEKYRLDEQTLAEPVDPNLVTGLQFR